MWSICSKGTFRDRLQPSCLFPSRENLAGAKQIGIVTNMNIKKTKLNGTEREQNKWRKGTYSLPLCRLSPLGLMLSWKKPVAAEVLSRRGVLWGHPVPAWAGAIRCLRGDCPSAVPRVVGVSGASWRRKRWTAIDSFISFLVIVFGFGLKRVLELIFSLSNYKMFVVSPIYFLYLKFYTKVETKSRFEFRMGMDQKALFNPLGSSGLFYIKSYI